MCLSRLSPSISLKRAFNEKELIFFVLAALISSPVAAQHVTTQSSGLQRSEAVIGVGLTIPFGGGAQQKEPARVDLRWTRDMLQADGSRLSDQTGRAFRGSLGIALDRDLDNRLLLNGRPIPKQDDRRGVSTLGWIAIGVTVIGAGIFVLYQVADAQSE